MNRPEESEYWKDNSYVKVLNKSSATKVSFGGFIPNTNYTSWYSSDYDHSAVTTSSTDILISKWGPSPRFKHHINDCPYLTTDLNYYAPSPPVISGPPARPWIMNNTIIATGSSVTYNMCIGQGTKSLYLTFVIPDNTAPVSSWEVTKKYNPNDFSLV